MTEKLSIFPGFDEHSGKPFSPQSIMEMENSIHELESVPQMTVVRTFPINGIPVNQVVEELALERQEDGTWVNNDGLQYSFDDTDGEQVRVSITCRF